MNDTKRIRQVGQRIAFRRKQKGMSAYRLAVNSGVSKGGISRIEHNGLNITLGTLYRIADAIGCNPATLV
jgi:transcriptional regulator with XRE-family HTH domain